MCSASASIVFPACEGRQVSARVCKVDIRWLFGAVELFTAGN